MAQLNDDSQHGRRVDCVPRGNRYPGVRSRGGAGHDRRHRRDGFATQSEPPDVGAEAIASGQTRGGVAARIHRTQARGSGREPAARVWLVYSFPKHTATHISEVLAVIQSDFELVRGFPGTLGDGTVYIHRSRAQ